MATVLKTEIDSSLIRDTFEIKKILSAAAIVGVSNWFFVALFDYYFEQIGIASNLAAVLSAFLGLFILIKMKSQNNAVVAFATLAVLWDMGVWTNGLVWWSVLIGSTVMYMLSYLLFDWIMSYKNISISLPLVFVVIIVLKFVTMVL